MTRLWQKYALVLFLVAIVPLAVGAARLASASSDEVRTQASLYQMAIGNAFREAVEAALKTSQLELRAIASTIGTTEIPADDRLRIASSQLVASEHIDTVVIFSVEGESVQTIEGGDANSERVSRITPPAQLEETLRVRASGEGFALERPTLTDKALYIPVVVPIRKHDGSPYGYAWSALDFSQLTRMLVDLSSNRLNEPNRVLLVDWHEGKPRILGPQAMRTADLLSGTPGPLATADFTQVGNARTLAITPPAGPELYGSVLTMHDLGLAVVVTQPHDEVFAPVRRIWSTALLIGGAFAALALLLGVLGGRRLSAPIAKVSHAARQVAAGDFSVRVPVAGRDEVADLGRSFNQMAGQLTATIQQLQETTAAKERMQTELAIGHNIQMSMVPLDFPAFPDRPEFDIHAALKPAFEVGGDFYDFFLVDEDTLCVCIADVSGKGVPAALFMAVTRTLVKTHATGGLGPDEILERVNDDLSRDNEESMFVTVFLGLLKLSTGQLTFTNAGHNPSYIKKKSGGLVRLEQVHGPVVAAIEEVPYASGTASMAAGDTLVLYTDGVNEAMNAKKELFTEERLAKLIADRPWDSSARAVDEILSDVWRFQGDADQADDVTVVALRYLGPRA